MYLKDENKALFRNILLFGAITWYSRLVKVKRDRIQSNVIHDLSYVSSSSLL